MTDNLKNKVENIIAEWLTRCGIAEDMRNGEEVELLKAILDLIKDRCKKCQEDDGCVENCQEIKSIKQEQIKLLEELKVKERIRQDWHCDCSSIYEHPIIRDKGFNLAVKEFNNCIKQKIEELKKIV